MIDFLAFSTEPPILSLVDNFIETTIFSTKEDPPLRSALDVQHTNIVCWKAEQRLRLKVHLSKRVGWSGYERCTCR